MKKCESGKREFHSTEWENKGMTRDDFTLSIASRWVLGVVSYVKEEC